MKRIAAVQSSYIPWKGYFSLIQMVDEFVLYDDVQYTHGDWRNRNRIRTPAGAEWLTIPVRVKGRHPQRVCEARIEDPIWARKHWQSLALNYARAPHFAQLARGIEKTYADCAGEKSLSRVNERFLRVLCALLEIATPLAWSMDLTLAGDRNERLIDLCRQRGAGEYLTGPAARAYLDEALFARAGIRVLWMDYGGYPEYRQQHAPPFVHEVTVLDLLFNEGRERAARYLAAFRDGAETRLRAGVVAREAARERPLAAAGDPTRERPAAGAEEAAHGRTAAGAGALEEGLR